MDIHFGRGQLAIGLKHLQRERQHLTNWGLRFTALGNQQVDYTYSVHNRLTQVTSFKNHRDWDLAYIGLQLAKIRTRIVDRSDKIAFDQRVETSKRVED